MAAAMGCRTQADDLGAQFNGAVIFIFGDVMEGSVNRHSESLWGGRYIYKMLGTVIVRNRDLRPQMGNPYEKEGICPLFNAVVSELS